MLNMSNQFYKYLSEVIINYFHDAQINGGDSYNIHFEEPKDVQFLYNALTNENGTEIFDDEDNGYQTYAINVGETKVLIAATVNDIKEDFLTYIRNNKGVKDSIYGDYAVLFIYDKDLDSIVKGSIPMDREGMPLYPLEIGKRLAETIEKSKLEKVEKEVLKFVVKKNEKDYDEAATTVFDYKELLEVVQKGNMDIKDYNNFGLFQDTDAYRTTYDVKTLKNRIKENYDIYKSIHDAHVYSNPEAELEKSFVGTGFDAVIKEDWKELEYDRVSKYKENGLKEKNPEYIQDSFKVHTENISCWDLADNEATKPGKRKRNIILFNPNGVESVLAEFKFDQRVKKAELKTKLPSESISTSGSSFRVIMKSDGVNFYKFNYAKAEFKVLIIQDKEQLLEEYGSAYRIKYKAKNQSKLVILDQSDKLVFFPNRFDRSSEVLREKNQIITLEEDMTLEIKKNLEKLDSEDEKVPFILETENYKLPLEIIEDALRPEQMNGLGVWKVKRERGQDFYYKYIDQKFKIKIGNREYYAKDEFRNNLIYEMQIVKNGVVYGSLDCEDLIEKDIDLPFEMREKYEEIIEYFDMKNTLPSLAYMTDELRSLYVDYLDIYNRLIEENQGQILLKEHQNIFKMGMIEGQNQKRLIYLSPLHPINVAYQLSASEQLEGEEDLDIKVLECFNGYYLLPYMYGENDELYRVVEQNHSPEWRYYAPSKTNRYNASKTYVPKLVAAKINEFRTHFKHLFLNDTDEIILNLVNLGNCNEILEGIFKYFKDSLQKKSPEEITPIILNICNEQREITVFEQLALYDLDQEIIDKINLKSKSKKYDERALVQIFKKKVCFYKKNREELDYGHITFCKIGTMPQPGQHDMDKLESGITLEGLAAGLKSTLINDNYITGFGVKDINEHENILIKTAMRTNSLAVVARKLSKLNLQETIITTVARLEQKELGKLYDCSNWVTFIDPQVDLAFFRCSDNKDLLIIHYSDQYTASGGYDSITVTKKTDQYKKIIKDYLKEKNVEIEREEQLDEIINMFNAINGEWLLKMITRSKERDQFCREKLSMLSAAKESLAFLEHEDILWLPLSLEEIFRASGGAGLSATEGLFTSKNLGYTGKISDDLLMVGIDNRDKLKVHYYPVEVKVGQNKDKEISKAKEQVTNAYNAFKEQLKEETRGSFNAKVYRNFFVQNIFSVLEKVETYNFISKEKIDRILTADVITSLKNDHYEACFDFEDIIGKGLVISFKGEFSKQKIERDKDLLIMTLTENQAYNTLRVPISKLRENMEKTSWMEDEFLIAKRQSNESSNVEDEASKCLQVAEKIDQEILDRDLEHKSEIESKEESKSSYSGEKRKVIEKNSDSRETMKILLGTDDMYGKEVYWYPTDTDKVLNTNTGIIGTMGTGKTQFTKSLITQLYQNQGKNVFGENIGVLIFDYKGDYIKEEFVKATNARVLELMELPINPLKIHGGEQAGNLLPLHTAKRLVDSISKASQGGLGQLQENALKNTILDAYTRRGIDKRDKSTWNNYSPTINEVAELYLSDEEVKTDKLYSMMEDFVDYELFESDPSNTESLFDLLDGVLVIDLHGDYSESLKDLVVALILDAFYSEMQAKGHSEIDGVYRQITKMILVDEADNFLRKGFESIRKILKEGREFGVGMVLSTQFLDHFSTSDNKYSQYICNWIVHKVDTINSKDIKQLFNTTSKSEEEELMNGIRDLQKHHSLIRTTTTGRPQLIRDKAFWELMKDARNE